MKIHVMFTTFRCVIFSGMQTNKFMVHVIFIDLTFKYEPNL